MFGSSKKSPQEAVKSLDDNLKIRLERDNEEANEYTPKRLQAVKNLLAGTDHEPPSPEMKAQVAQEFYNSSVFVNLIKCMPKIDLESRKDFVVIFTILLERQVGSRCPTVEYLQDNDEIIRLLMEGYEDSEIALTCGHLLRKCFTYESLASLLYEMKTKLGAKLGAFGKLIKIIQSPAADIASDAFETFKYLLTRHQTKVATFLTRFYNDFFSDYQQLLKLDNEVIRLQAFVLLYELLIDRHNFDAMQLYVQDADNLKQTMILLRAPSTDIQFEAFHIFKLFVANPNKSQAVFDILKQNQDKLISYLSDFQNERSDNEQFIDERTYVLEQLKGL